MCEHRNKTRAYSGELVCADCLTLIPQSSLGLTDTRTPEFIHVPWVDPAGATQFNSSLREALIKSTKLSQ